jgi:ABC-type nitrate/sulfonate/bicarbonate transport system substrate-binding protein
MAPPTERSNPLRVARSHTTARNHWTEAVGLPAQAECHYYPAYASLATAGIQTWIEQHIDEVTSYITAYRKALRWIYDPTHALEVQAMMQKEPTLGLDASLALHVYAAFVDPRSGFGQEAMLDDAGLQQVIDLRATYASTPIIERDLAYYRNLRWYPNEGNIR